MFLQETFVIEDCMKVYKLDGTESIKTLGNYGTPTITNNTLQCGSGVLVDGFDNNQNWILEAECFFEDTSTDIMIIPSSITIRDEQSLQIMPSGFVQHESHTSWYGKDFSPYLQTNTWYTFRITKNGTTFTVEIGEQSQNISWEVQSSSSTLQIGVDRWTYSKCAKLRNIKVKAL